MELIELNDDWRVKLDKQGLQWLLQKAGKKPGKWNTIGYYRRAAPLRARVMAQHDYNKVGHITTKAQQALFALPRVLR